MPKDILGTGWKFPLQVDAQGGIATAQFDQRVAESISFILGTAQGERVMLPDFGCQIHDLVFDPINVLTQGRVMQLVRKGLVEYEPRIDVLDVQVSNTPGQPNLLLIRIDYRVRSNNAFQNLVYPFYITEQG